MKLDLHIHTDKSDGTLTISEVLRKTAQNNFDMIAITDHDNIDSLIEGRTEAENQKFKVVPGVEMSTEEDDKEYHILGYGIDLNNNVLRRLLHQIKEGRIVRAKNIIKKLQIAGVDIEYKELESKVKGVIGRLHIGRELRDKGYGKTAQEVFNKYLIPGKPAYEKHFPIRTSEVIQVIIKAGGVAVWAHPVYSQNDGIISHFINCGLKGIEVFHVMHKPNMQKHYLDLALKHNLLITGGSDFHSEGEPFKFGSFRVNESYSGKIYNDFLKYAL